MPARQSDTRYCPSCSSTDLVIDGDVISCKQCERILRVDRAADAVEDPAWVRTGKRS